MTRRRAVTVPSDDEETEPKPEETRDEPSKPQKRATGKLKSVKNGKTSSSRSTKNASPQQSPNKPKPKAQNAPKPAGKPIYSFFNAATQRQQSTQSAASSQKTLPLADDDLEAIHDDSDEENSRANGSTTALSKGSSVASAMRKRRFQSTQNLDDTSVPPAGSQKFRKAGGGERIPSFTVKNEDKRPWTDQFAPTDLSELAVHKRKVADVQEWLEMAYRGRRQKVLVLKGAAGVGKTTTVQLLAKDLGIDLLEWKDSTASDYTTEGSVSTAVRFEEFMARAGKSGGLQFATDGLNQPVLPERLPQAENTADSSLQALLVEEFPNTFSRTSSALQSFRTAIAQHVSTTVPIDTKPTPVILVISETLLSTNTAAADSFTAHRLLGPELMTNPYVNTIEFNAVAPTFLTKALETIVVKEARKSGRRRTPGPLVLKHLAETGDIRSAVSSLEFLCLRGDDGDTWSSKVTFTKTKQSKTQPPLTKAEEEALKLISNRESSLGIFHSVGKVVYNKRVDPTDPTAMARPPPWLPQHRRSKVPETNVDLLIDELGTDTPTFVAGLHENYALSCSSYSAEDSLDSLVGCTESLSDSDLLSLDRFSFGTRAFSGSTTDSLRQDEMSFQVAVRGMLFNLPHPVHRSAAVGGNRADAHRMFYPASLRLWRKKEEIEGNLEVLMSKLGSGEMSRAASGAAQSSGVESWKQKSSFKAKGPQNDSSDADVEPHHGTEIKNEMLLERLPYMAQILGSSKRDEALLDRIRPVIRVSDSVNAQGDDADPDDTEESGEGLNAEAWTTDRPDAEPGVAPARPEKQTASKQKPAFEASSIPVESRVEKLVLEDDDIVDD